MNQHVASIREARPDPFPPINLSREQIRERCGGAPIWHSIDLGDGWIEGDRKTAAILDQELRSARLPDLSGKTVLDVGAFGGFFSFEAARRGAEVTAIDYYSWATDFPKLHEWIAKEKAAGRDPNDYEPPASVFDPEKSPGRKAFNTINECLGSPVTAITTTLEDFTPDKPFDVTLYFGVLYHTRDPFGALRKLAEVTSGLAIIETLAFHDPANPSAPYWNFHGGDRSVNDDPTTYWSPSAKGLEHMLLRAGFESVELLNAPARAGLYRLWAHASSRTA